MGDDRTRLTAPSEPLDDLNEEQVKYLQENLHKLIDHAVGRIHYAESRRSGFITIGGALFAASIAIIALSLSSIHFYPLRLALICFGVSGMLVSFSLWAMYARQTNFRYPFTAVTRTWKWFYRDALPDRNAFKVPFHLRMSTEAFERGKKAFTEQWPRFETEQKRLVDLRASTHQDLQQMYVLHVNDYFKNLFLTHLRSVLQGGLAAALIVFVIALVIGFALQDGGTVVKGPSVYSKGKMTLEASWRPTGRSRAIGVGGTEAQMLANFRITNAQNDPVIINSLIAKDVQEMRLPIFVESLSPAMPWAIPPNSTGDFVGLVWIPEPLMDQLLRFEAGP